MMKRSLFEVTLIVFAISFFTLAIIVESSPLLLTDLQISRFVQQMKSPAFTSVMLALSLLGELIFAVGIVTLVSILLYLNKRRKQVFFLLISFSGGLLLSASAKTLIGRSRPGIDIITQIGSYKGSDSFPSGHVLEFISVYGFLAYLALFEMSNTLYKILTFLVLTLLIILISVSRIYLGAHWFSDVVGSWLLGLTWLSIVVFFYRKKI